MPTLYETIFSPLPGKHARENLLYLQSCGFLRVVPGERFLRQNVSGYDITYVTDGEGDLLVEGNQSPFGKGSLILLPLQTRHGYIADVANPYECFYIHFEGEQVGAVLGRCTKKEGSMTIEPADGAAVISVFREILQQAEHQPPFWETRISLLIYQLVMEFYRSYASGDDLISDEPDWLKETSKWIEDNLPSEIKVQHLAGKANMSLYHFSRLFRKYTGHSPMEYVQIRRVNRAKQWIMKSNKKMEEISGLSGFPSHYSMIHNFKKFEGKAPSGFRRVAEP